MSISSIMGSSYSSSYGSQDTSNLYSSSDSGSLGSMSGDSGSGLMGGVMDKQTFGAQVVSKTLDYLHGGSMGGGSKKDGDYGFQMDVLGSMGARKGIITNTLV